MSQLSELSGVHPSTIKFYISEGLVPRGHLIASNRAVYGREHVERLGFIRTLVTVGGVSISTLKRVIAALSEGSLTAVLAAAQDAVRNPDDVPLPAREQTEDAVRRKCGIDAVSPLFHHPSIRRIAAALDASEPYLGPTFETWADSLLGAGRDAALADLTMVTGADAEAAARYAVVGIPLGDVVISQSRRLWQSVITSRAYGPGPTREPEDQG
ncbi:MAG TPA: MerR family transcriptional regulator [Pseudolysinimonas sp.]|nr:MerR family transcriptional regulator [Pseudolysinimonas sp.]